MLFPGGSPREDGESAEAWRGMCSVSMSLHAGSSLKWPRKGVRVHSDSSSPLRTFTPQTYKAHNSDIYPIQIESKTLLPAVLGPGIVSFPPSTPVVCQKT